MTTNLRKLRYDIKIKIIHVLQYLHDYVMTNN